MQFAGGEGANSVGSMFRFTRSQSAGGRQDRAFRLIRAVVGCAPIVPSVRCPHAKGRLRIEPGKARLLNTRDEVLRAWRMVSDILIRERQPELAVQVRQIVEQMSPPHTEKEHIAARLKTRDAVVRDLALLLVDT